jgi:hypothetical protein
MAARPSSYLQRNPLHPSSSDANQYTRSIPRAEFGRLPGGSKPIAATLASDGTITARVSRVRVERARELVLVRSGTITLRRTRWSAWPSAAMTTESRHGTSASMRCHKLVLVDRRRTPQFDVLQTSSPAHMLHGQACQSDLRDQDVRRRGELESI